MLHPTTDAALAKACFRKVREYLGCPGILLAEMVMEEARCGKLPYHRALKNVRDARVARYRFGGRGD